MASSIYELKIGTEKLEVLKFLLEQLGKLETMIEYVSPDNINKSFTEIRTLINQNQEMKNSIDETAEKIDQTQKESKDLLATTLEKLENIQNETKKLVDDGKAYSDKKTDELIAEIGNVTAIKDELKEIENKLKESIKTNTTPAAELQTQIYERINELKGELSQKIGGITANISKLKTEIADELATKDELENFADEIFNKLDEKLDVSSTAENSHRLGGLEASEYAIKSDVDIQLSTKLGMNDTVKNSEKLQGRSASDFISSRYLKNGDVAGAKQVFGVYGIHYNLPEEDAFGMPITKTFTDEPIVLNGMAVLGATYTQDATMELKILKDAEISTTGIFIITGANHITGYSDNIHWREIPEDLGETEYFVYFYNETQDKFILGRV